MIKTRFSRWLTFFTFAAAVALALPAKANTVAAASGQSSGWRKQILCGGK